MGESPVAVKYIIIIIIIIIIYILLSSWKFLESRAVWKTSINILRRLKAKWMTEFFSLQ